MHGIEQTERAFGFNGSFVYTRESKPVGSSVSTGSVLIVFIHGRFGQVESWKPLVESLSPLYRCYAIDLPGFGRSYSIRGHPFSLMEHTALVHQLVLKIKTEHESVILVGHDVGGVIAQLCLLRSPREIAGVVLINSSSLLEETKKLNVGFRGYWIRKQLSKLLDEVGEADPYLRDALLNPWQTARSRKILVSSLWALGDSWPLRHERQHWRQALQNVNQPVLLLWGGQDKINPPELAVDLMKRIPNAKFFIHEQCGHWAHLIAPDWALSKIKQFIFQLRYVDLATTTVQKALLR